MCVCVYVHVCVCACMCVQGDIPRRLWDNFLSYGLPVPEVVRMDLHLWDQHTRGGVAAEMFDAIVTDPPVS